ncbi:hypothetical protein NEOLI_000110 [Neolecta irregularis DAH-3]|uniref:Uncharacterized protein n=1 Tax=Neolecta irregularis (strain DAH-3) TaxID=1198029 RepID=A0A1U7LQT4_NEOID|nr:hypothetical protein NEOLI_000110 [Neolecta irregularis DAH-3]|eukprot:OLL25004.1 hypothetical protein NEOLI_000110 [Neolecta irregularis DAH-3]
MWPFSSDTDKAANVLSSLDPDIRQFLNENLPAPSPRDSQPKQRQTDIAEGRDGFMAAGKRVAEQRRAISRAARANCAAEEFELHDCYMNGSWKDTQTLCDRWRTRFWRCVDAQKHTLATFDYGNPNNGEKLNDIIQGKADNLFQKYLKQTNQDHMEK